MPDPLSATVCGLAGASSVNVSEALRLPAAPGVKVRLTLHVAPGANVGDGYACFEATHGTAPKYADKDVINPGSVILSGVMMLRFLGWKEAADLVESGLERTIEQKKVTYDFERLMEGATKVKTSEFANFIIENMSAGVLTAAD